MKQKYYLVISAGIFGYWVIDENKTLRGKSWAILAPTPNDRETTPYKVVLLGNFEGNLFIPSTEEAKCYRSLESFTSGPFGSTENFYTSSIPEDLVDRLLLLAEI